MQDPLPGNEPGNEIVTARDDVLGVSLDDCLVLYDPRTGRAHVLDSGAARIWGMLQGGSTATAITAELAATTRASEGVIATDVMDTVAHLAGEQLVGAESPSPAGPPPPLGTAGADAIPLAGTSDSGRPRSATFSTLDRTVAFESDSPDVVSAINWLAAPLTAREPPGAVYEIDPAPERARLFPSRLNRIAAASPAVAALHAGAVVAGDVVVALPGAPHAGKSTLTTQLVVDGYGYLTDEVLGIAPQSLGIVGFPKRITLELGSWSLFPHIEVNRGATTHAAFDPSRVRWVDPRSLHANALAWRGRPLELSMGVLPCYRAGAALLCERLSPVDVLTELLANSFNLDAMGVIGLATLRGVATSVPFYRLTHGGVDEAVPAIRDLLAHEGLAVPS